MIRIEITRENGHIVYLSAKGHALSDEEGKDLVCAAISAIITGGLNALDNPKSFGIILEKGYASISSLKDVNNHDYEVLDVIYTQLKTVEEDNKKYIKIVEKGC